MLLVLGLANEIRCVVLFANHMRLVVWSYYFPRLGASHKSYLIVLLKHDIIACCNYFDLGFLQSSESHPLEGSTMFKVSQSDQSRQCPLPQ